MSKYANPGELRTKVWFIRKENSCDAEGFPDEKTVNAVGNGISVKVKWVNAHGTDTFTAMQLKLREPATITMRYSPRITPDLLVYKGSDPEPYEIISIDNVEERNRWLEIKVQRKVAAR